MLDVKIPAVVVEKDQAELKSVCGILDQMNEISIVGKTISSGKGITMITNYVPRLVMVNTELKGENGIDFVKRLHHRNIFPEIIFMSENKMLAYRSLEVQPFDYLIKPLMKDHFSEALVRLKEKLRKKELMQKMQVFKESTSDGTKRIFKQNGGIIVLLLSEIIYARAKLTTCILYLRDNETAILKTGINETLDIINNDDFIKIGRSYFINRKYIRKIDKKNLKCQLLYEGNSWEVPISRNTLGILEKLNVSNM